MENNSTIRINDENILMMLYNQNIPLRADTFFLDLAPWIQHEE